MKVIGNRVTCCGCEAVLAGDYPVILMDGDPYCEECFRDWLDKEMPADIAERMGFDVCEVGDIDPPPSEWDLYFDRF